MGILLGPVDSDDPAITVYRSLPPLAPWWQLLLPMLFGRQRLQITQNVIAWIWEWRGRSYLERTVYLGRTHTD